MKRLITLSLTAIALCACGEDDQRIWEGPGGEKITYRINQDEGTAQNKQMMNALTLCQHNFKQAVLDPDNTKAPYVEGRVIGGEYLFAWNHNTKLIRTRSRQGNNVPATGSCTVGSTKLDLRSMTLNGQTIYPR